MDYVISFAYVLGVFIGGIIAWHFDKKEARKYLFHTTDKLSISLCAILWPVYIPVVILMIITTVPAKYASDLLDRYVNQ